MTEEEALGERRRDGRAVHGDERLLGPVARLMDRAGHELLACARFALNKNAQRRLCDLVQAREDLPHLARRSHEETKLRVASLHRGGSRGRVEQGRASDLDLGRARNQNARIPEQDVVDPRPIRRSEVPKQRSLLRRNGLRVHLARPPVGENDRATFVPADDHGLGADLEHHLALLGKIDGERAAPYLHVLLVADDRLIHRRHHRIALQAWGRVSRARYARSPAPYAVPEAKPVGPAQRGHAWRRTPHT